VRELKTTPLSCCMVRHRGKMNVDALKAAGPDALASPGPVQIVLLPMPSFAKEADERANGLALEILILVGQGRSLRLFDTGWAIQSKHRRSQSHRDSEESHWQVLPAASCGA